MGKQAISEYDENDDSYDLKPSQRAQTAGPVNRGMTASAAAPQLRQNTNLSAVMVSSASLGFRQSSTLSGRSSSAASSLIESDTQTTLIRTFENFYQAESETLITTLEESRDEIKNSMLELCLEQERCKEELYRLSDGRYNFRRKRGKLRNGCKCKCKWLNKQSFIYPNLMFLENSVPLSEYLRRKKGLSKKTEETPEEELTRRERRLMKKEGGSKKPKKLFFF